MHYYTKNIGDYRRDTMQLSLLEHGIYTTLIDHYLLNEKPLSLDQSHICWLIGAKTEEEKIVTSRLIDGFFEETDKGYIHKRCDEEIATYHSNLEVRRTNGRKGGIAKNQTPTKHLANQEPITKNQEPVLDLFEEFWKTYPHRNGNKKTKKDSVDWWKKQSLDTITIVLKATKIYKKHIEKCHNDNVFDGGVPDPIKYLKKERYLDELDVKSTNSAFAGGHK